MAQKKFAELFLWHWHFPNFPILRSKKNFLNSFSQNFVKNALCGVVGSERIFKRVWETSQQAKSVRRAIARAADLRKRVPFSYACSETYHLANTERKGKEWIGNQKSRTAAICRKKGSRQRKPSATKLAAHTMKCLPPAAALNGSATRWCGS